MFGGATKLHRFARSLENAICPRALVRREGRRPRGRAQGGDQLPAERNRGGRPVGARNKRTDEGARIYMDEFGDPLRRGTHIAALDPRTRRARRPGAAPGVRAPRRRQVVGQSKGGSYPLPRLYETFGLVRLTRLARDRAVGEGVRS